MALLSPGPASGRRRAPSAAGLLAGWLAATCLAGVAVPARGQTGEYDVKAAFLFNFTKFVEWPPAAFADADQPLSLCVLGRDPFGGILDDMVRGESVGGRRLVVRRLERNADLRPCHVLFVAGSEGARAARILAPLKDGHVLTVGESTGFLEAGGLLRFVLVETRVRFEINRQAIDRSPLMLSSKLLRLAINSGEGSTQGSQ